MNILVFDTETTGLDYRKHEMVQIAAVLLDEKLNELDHFCSYIRPEKPESADKRAMEVNGLSLTELESAPVLRKVMKEFREKFGTRGDYILCGHNVSFDIGFLKKAHDRLTLDYDYNYETLDTMALATATNTLGKTTFKRFKLTKLCETFKIKTDNAHDALADVRMTAELIRRLMNLLDGKDKATKSGKTKK